MPFFLKFDSVLSLFRGLLCLTWMSLRGAVVSRGGDEVKRDPPPLLSSFFPERRLPGCLKQTGVCCWESHELSIHSHPWLISLHTHSYFLSQFVPPVSSFSNLLTNFVITYGKNNINSIDVDVSEI